MRGPRLPGGLLARLLGGHLVVIVVGLVTLLATFSLAAPPVFERHMAEMGGRGPMMGQGRLGPMAELERQVEEAYRQTLVEALGLATLAALATAAGLSLVASRQVAGPIRRLAAASRRIARGRYDERVPEVGPQELGQLAASFNTMAESLEQVERRRLELIGDVAHELRTPIATLEGYLEGLLDGVVEPSAETWARLHTEAGRLRRLVDDLQELSRAEAGQLAVTPRAFDLGEVVRAAVERLEPDFEAKGIEGRAEVGAGLPLAHADPERVLQVLTNLLTNALRYTPEAGRVVASVGVGGAGELGSRGAGGTGEGGVARLLVSVRDTGVGIAAEELGRVFERFYRVDRSRSRALGGSGIGLTIARALVEAMGGQIWAESAGMGRGATFRFTLPVAP